jgi:hypothetical protein
MKNRHSGCRLVASFYEGQYIHGEHWRNGTRQDNPQTTQAEGFAKPGEETPPEHPVHHEVNIYR